MAKVSDVIATYRPTRVRAPSRAHAAFPNPQPLTQPSSSKLPTCTTHRSTSIPQANSSSSHVPTTLCTSTTQRQAPMQRSSSRKSTALHSHVSLTIHTPSSMPRPSSTTIFAISPPMTTHTSATSRATQTRSPLSSSVPAMTPSSQPRWTTQSSCGICVHPPLKAASTCTGPF